MNIFIYEYINNYLDGNKTNKRKNPKGCLFII